MHPQDREKSDVVFLLSELTKRIEFGIDEMLQKQYGISYSEWRLMMAIFLAQEAPTQEHIAEIADKTPAAVSRQIDYLERKDLAIRMASPTSRRIRIIKLTKNGQAVFQKALLTVSKQSQIIFKYLGSEEKYFKQYLLHLLEYLDGTN